MGDTESEHIDWFMNRYRAFEGDDISEETLEKRRNQIERFRDWYGSDLSEVTDNDIEQFVIEKSADNAPTTINSYRWALSKFYRHMESKGRIEEDPIQEVNWKDIGVASRTTRKKQEATDGKRIHPLSEEEVEKLKANVPDPKIRNELMIRLMLQTGMRAGELARLKLDNVDQENREIYIDESKSKARWVGYQPSLSMLMEQWIDGGHRDVVDTDDSPYLFPTRQSQRIKINRINDVVRTAAEEAGIQEELYEDANGHTRYRVTSHSLRHTFAVMALSPSVGERSLNIGYLRDVMGHEDISTTQEYLQYLNEDAVESMKMAGPSL